VIPELPRIISGFASCYPKFPNKIRVSGISGSGSGIPGSGFGLRVFCPALIRYHFLRDHQQKGDIEISYINTKDQLADIFTKPLDEQTFNKLRHELNILDSRNFFC
jgi:hypothetical protein